MANENKMGYLPIKKLILQMSLPPMCSMFLQYSYNLVDSMFVANINENALAAVSLSFPITTLMISLSIWIGVGINVLIAGYLGEKEQDLADCATTLGLLVALIVGICINILALLIMKPYFSAFTNNPAIFNYAMQYMSVCAFMQVPNMVHIAIQKVFQGTGNMITPMWFQIAGVIFNFVFDPLLIFGIGPFPKMGIRGAALATVLGYALSMVIAFLLLVFTKQKVRIKIKGFHVDSHMLKNLFSYGFPSFVMNALGSFMLTFTNLFLTAYSDTVVAFFGAYFKVQQMIFMTVNGLIQGCLPVMRFNYSAKQPERLKEAFHFGTQAATVMMIGGTCLLLFLPKQILFLFAASESMIKIGVPAMRILSIGLVFCGFSIMIATYQQAIEKIQSSMLIHILRQGILLVPLMWLFNHMFGINGIWISFPVTEILVFIVAVLLQTVIPKPQ